MYRLFGAFLAVLTILASQPVQAEEATFTRVVESKTIRCGYFIWPTYMSKDANTGKFSGINYEIMEAVGKNLGMTIEWVSEVGVGDVAAALESKKFDVMCATLWPSAGRMQSLTLTMPTFYSGAYAFVRADDKRFDGNLDKANNKSIKVSAIEGDVTEDLAKERLPGATLVALPPSASGAEILLQLITKKADIALVDEGMVSDFLKTNPDALRKVEGIPMARVFGENIALRRGDLMMKNMLDESIRQLINDGVIGALTDKYAKQYKAHFIAPSKTYVMP